MASNTTNRLPLEIWLQILAYLPLTDICKSRIVSRAWNERLMSAIVVDIMLKRAGFVRRFEDQEMERNMRMQMWKGHAKGKAVKHLTIPLKRHHLRISIRKLMDDRLIVTDRQTREISVFDVSVGKKESTTYMSGYLSEVFLTEQLYGGHPTAETLFWQEHVSKSISRISTPRSLYPFAAAGKVIAGLDYQPVSNYSAGVYLLDTETKEWANFPVDLETSSYKNDFNCGFAIDEEFVTVFYLYTTSQYVLVIKRYSYHGTLVFEKRIPFESGEPFTVGHADNYLEVSCSRSSPDGGQCEITSALARILYVDVGSEMVVNLPEGLTVSWNNFVYSFEDTALCSFQVENGVLKRKNVLDWTGSRVHQFAVNDRWMCVLASKDDTTYLEVFDFAKE